MNKNTFITSYTELKEVFKIRDDRTIAALKNKITIDDNDIYVNDYELCRIIDEFRKGGALTVKQAAEYYGVREHTIISMEKNNLIPSYSLIDNKGSKLLFLKTELEAEKEFILMKNKYHRNGIERLMGIIARMLPTIQSSIGAIDRDVDIFIMYYLKGHDYGNIAEKYDLTKQRIIQLINKINTRIFHWARHSISYESVNVNYRNQYIRLIREYEALKKLVIDDTVLKQVQVNNNEVFDLEFRDMDISVRLLNSLYSCNIKTIRDVLKYTTLDTGMVSLVYLLKFRNFGKKCLNEIIELLEFHGIEYRNKRWYLNGTLLNTVII